MGTTKIHTKEFIERIAKDLEEWSLLDDSHFLSGFVSQHKEYIRLQALTEFAAANDKFAETLCKVKERLCNRLMHKACYRKIDGNFAAKVLPLISLDYREWRQQELKIASEGKREPIEIVIKGSEQ